MDFGLSDEQQQLSETLTRFLDEAAPIATTRKWFGGDGGEAAALWRSLAELGAPGILVPEAYGGSALSLFDAAVAAQALGSRVAPVPFLGSAVLAPVALRAAASAAQQERWLPGIAAGTCRVGVAATELTARRADAGVTRSGGRLRGKALLAIDAIDADAFLVPAGESVDHADSLAWVPRESAGLRVTPLPTIDKTRGFAALDFENVEPAEWLGAPGRAGEAIARMLDAGRVIVAADILGACDRALALSVEYAQHRVQFGRPIASFQAVKHLCAEMAAELEPARSLVWYAAHAFDAVPEEAALMAAHAKAHLSEIGRFIVRTATEVHGGIGFTDEQNLHFWFKRVGVDRPLLGAPEALRERAAELQGWLSA